MRVQEFDEWWESAKVEYGFLCLHEPLYVLVRSIDESCVGELLGQGVGGGFDVPQGWGRIAGRHFV